MDSRKPRVVVGIVGLLFALIGFFVSVVAILLALLVAVPAPRLRDAPPRIMSPSNYQEKPASFNNLAESSSVSSSAPSTSKNGELDTTLSKVNDTPVSRAGSFPFQPQHQRVERDHKIKPNLKPTIITLPPIELLHDRTSESETSRPPRISTSEAYLSVSDDSRSGFRLANLRPPWGDKRPKVYRCVSSPHLTTRAAPLPPPREERASFLVKKKSKTLRKALSIPNRPGSPPNKSSTTLVKKRSQPLRTQPYEAPYFFPPPIPTRDIPRRERPIRARTLPLSHSRSSRSPSPAPPPVRTISPEISTKTQTTH